MRTTLAIAVIGHGEAGSRWAASLANCGLNVVGFDPVTPKKPTVPIASSLEEAVSGADIVFSINSATVAVRIAEHVVPSLSSDAIYVDLNTATPALKEKLAAIIPPHQFVDGAIMEPVPGATSELPTLVSGLAAQRLVDLLAPINVALEFVSQVAGQAAARNLTRSILAKCVAGVVVDFMWAAEAMGLSDWAYDELLKSFDSMSAETAKEYLAGTVANVKRREIEMLDIVEMLDHVDYHSIFVPPTQLIYNRVYHSIKVPFGTRTEQEAYEEGGNPAPENSGW